MQGSGWNLTVLEHDPMEGSYEQGHELSGSTKIREFYKNMLTDYDLLKKKFSPWTKR
jgi:hypothetical protein